jgi:subtilisin family serine protease
MRMSRRRGVLAAVASAALLVPLGLSSAQAAPGDEPPPAVPLVRPEGLTRPASETPTTTPTISPTLDEAEGVVTAFVELDAPSGIETAEAGGDAADVAAAADEVTDIAEDVVPADAGEVPGDVPAKVDVTTTVVSGVVVTGDAAQIRALASDPAVVGVHLVVPKTIDNKGTDVFTRAAEAWASAGATGTDVTIGVIDTGMDYTHATFGGTGTPEAYALAYGVDGTGPIPDGVFDPEKFLGGYDFAGPLYDASGDIPGSSLDPTPDANPIDAPHNAGGGHGSHVSGTAAGYGVVADGSTFDGDYATLTDISDWQIGPGSAPEAGVYALKVFGDVGGSTSLVISALEWAADPNGDSDLSDHLDIVNMSLGSDFSTADDPENLFVDELAALGVLTVSSAGNGADVTDVGGSPGNARSALSVANSVGNTQTYDAVEVTEAPDAALVGEYAAQNSVNYAGTDDVTAPVSFIGADISGCTSLEAYRAQIEDTIVWLYWDDDDASRECGSATRWDNAEAAGAVGVLIGSELPVFSAGIAGNAGIPGAQLTGSSTDALLPAIEAGGVVVHLGPSLANAAFVTEPALGDTLNSGSSRGVHGSLGTVKPDVAAPGTLISSAASSTGNGRVTYSGTSMSSPHVAGIAALVAQTHPTWTPLQIKAAVMNTATHDVYSELGQTGPVYGPERVGSGRVDAVDAAGATVLAYATDAPDLVSVTFGVVPVGATPTVLTEAVTVANTGDTARTFATSFAGATTAGGATITVSPAEVTVPAGGTAEVTVTLTADPATLARDIDPTQEPTYLGGGVSREYVTSISGRLVLTPADGPELRVPVQAAPKPFSELASPSITFAADQTEAPLTVEGRGVAAGGWYSLMAPFALTASSPEIELGEDTGAASAFRAADLKYVGFASTAPELAAAGLEPADGTIALGIATYGEWSTLGGAVVPIIDTDIDGDGIWDLETYVWKYAADLDLTTVETYALEFDPATGYALGDLVDIYEANGLSGALDTSVFDSNVLVVPMNLAAVGITPGDTPTFSVATYSPYAEATGGIVDEADPFTIDPFDPPVWFDSDPTSVEDTVWYLGQPGSDVTVHRSAEGAETDLLVLHTHNATGERAQVVDVVVQEPKDASVTVAIAPRSVPRGIPVPVSVVIRSAGAPPTGVVEVYEGDERLGSARVLTIRRTGFAVVLVRGLAVGSHHLTVSYGGNDQVAGSSDEVDVRVQSPRGHGHR